MSEPLKATAGQTFGRWTLVSKREEPGEERWLCICTCGTTKILKVTVMRNGHSRSCGCLRRESHLRITNRAFQPRGV